MVNRSMNHSANNQKGKQTLSFGSGAPSEGEKFGRLDHALASDQTRSVGIMKTGEDSQTRVLRRVWNYPDDQRHAFLITQLHHLAYFRCAVHIHGVQPAQVGEQPKAGFQVSHQRDHLVAALRQFFRPHFRNEAQVEQLLLLMVAKNMMPPTIE